MQTTLTGYQPYFGTGRPSAPPIPYSALKTAHNAQVFHESDVKDGFIRKQRSQENLAQYGARQAQGKAAGLRNQESLEILRPPSQASTVLTTASNIVQVHPASPLSSGDRTIDVGASSSVREDAASGHSSSPRGESTSPPAPAPAVIPFSHILSQFDELPPAEAVQRPTLAVPTSKFSTANTSSAQTPQVPDSSRSTQQPRLAVPTSKFSTATKRSS